MRRGDGAFGHGIHPHLPHQGRRILQRMRVDAAQHGTGAVFVPQIVPVNALREMAAFHELFEQKHRAFRHRQRRGRAEFSAIGIVEIKQRRFKRIGQKPVHQIARIHAMGEQHFFLVALLDGNIQVKGFAGRKFEGQLVRLGVEDDADHRIGERSIANEAGFVMPCVEEVYIHGKNLSFSIWMK